MIPGEYQIAKGNIALNQGREICTIVVATGTSRWDRTITFSK